MSSIDAIRRTDGNVDAEYPAPNMCWGDWRGFIAGPQGISPTPGRRLAAMLSSEENAVKRNRVRQHRCKVCRDVQERWVVVGLRVNVVIRQGTREEHAIRRKTRCWGPEADSVGPPYPMLESSVRVSSAACAGNGLRWAMTMSAWKTKSTIACYLVPASLPAPANKMASR